MGNEYTIGQRLSNEELTNLLNQWNSKYANKIAVHAQSKGFYKVDNFCVLNENGGAELAVAYHPIENGSMFDFKTIQHVRPCSEFFDGRFII